jgi:hypothetical protein
MFYLDSPKRAVIDLPNTFLDKSVRNKEVPLCQDGSCNDIARIGQFEYNIARIVITSDKAEKYLPIYSQDMQSLFLVDSDKLNHTSLVSNVSNINRAFVRRIDSKTNELILSFSSPIVHSILRTENSLNFFLFNVQSYNEQELIKVLNNSAYKQFTLSLLPQIGVRAAMPIGKNDLVKIEGEEELIRDVSKEEAPYHSRGYLRNVHMIKSEKNRCYSYSKYSSVRHERCEE